MKTSTLFVDPDSESGAVVAHQPVRIQRKRTKGWRMPEGAIYVGRPTKWGNPDAVGDFVTVTGAGEFQVDVPLTADIAVTLYRARMAILLATWPGMHPEDRAYTQGWIDGLAELRGRDLVCWCPLDLPCHADVLLDLANRERAS